MHSTPPPTCDSLQRGGGVRVKGPGLEGRILGPGLQEAARLAGGRPATPGGQAGGWADGRPLGRLTLSLCSFPWCVPQVAIVWNLLCFFWLARYLLPDYWAERALVQFGQSTGVTATGPCAITARHSAAGPIRVLS